MFKFKGMSSIEMKVLIEEEEHFIAKAAQRYNAEEIDGQDGAVLTPLGYAQVNRPIKVQLLPGAVLDDVLSWLNGEGEFEYNSRITTARFYSQIDPIRAPGIKIMDFTFLRDPFWYKKNDGFVLITDSITNEGNIYSKPIIRLEKKTSNSIDLTINGLRFKYNFVSDNYVEIDCEDMNATMDNMFRNNQLEIGFDFPVLEPGTNPIIVNSGDALIKIKYKDRWL